jgi:hypothetical protein
MVQAQMPMQGPQVCGGDALILSLSFRTGVDSDVMCPLIGTVLLSFMALFFHDLLVPLLPWPYDFIQTSNSGPNMLSYCTVIEILTVKSKWKVLRRYNGKIP